MKKILFLINLSLIYIIFVTITVIFSEKIGIPFSVFIVLLYTVNYAFFLFFSKNHKKQDDFQSILLLLFILTPIIYIFALQLILKNNEMTNDFNEILKDIEKLKIDKYAKEKREEENK
jgi:prolipoprotein diacylglyceryltransferase